MASFMPTSEACIRCRLPQKSRAIASASRPAAASSPSVITSDWLHSSGTSVNGLPIIIAAARAPCASRPLAWRMISP